LDNPVDLDHPDRQDPEGANPDQRDPLVRRDDLDPQGSLDHRESLVNPDHRVDRDLQDQRDRAEIVV